MHVLMTMAPSPRSSIPLAAKAGAFPVNFGTLGQHSARRVHLPSPTQEFIRMAHIRDKS